MDFNHFRFSGSNESTLSLLMLPNSEFLCYALEDPYNAAKVYGNTRIPAGRYEIKFRKEGKLYQEYIVDPAFKGINIQRGMLYITGIPGFDLVMYHCGNKSEDTLGCPLVCNKPNNNQIEKGFGADSKLAFVRFYPKIADILETEQVFVSLYDEQTIFMR